MIHSFYSFAHQSSRKSSALILELHSTIHTWKDAATPDVGVCCCAVGPVRGVGVVGVVPAVGGPAVGGTAVGGTAVGGLTGAVGLSIDGMTGVVGAGAGAGAGADKVGSATQTLGLSYSIH